MEVDNQFKPIENGISELRGDKIWFFPKMVSPSGEQIVYTDTVDSKTTLCIETVDEAQKTWLFEDEYNYYEPAWAPDGAKIVFVSDRP